MALLFFLFLGGQAVVDPLGQSLGVPAAVSIRSRGGGQLSGARCALRYGGPLYGAGIGARDGLLDARLVSAEVEDSLAELLPEGPSCTAIQHLLAAVGHEVAPDALEEAMEARAPLETAGGWRRLSCCRREPVAKCQFWRDRLRSHRLRGEPVGVGLEQALHPADTPKAEAQGRFADGTQLEKAHEDENCRKEKLAD